MSDQSSTFASFVSMWAYPGPGEPEDEVALANLETHFSVCLPDAYREFISRYGAIYTPNLLDAIVDGHHEMHDVQNFFGTQEAIEATEAYVSGGMEVGFLGFASDCMGNLFCFNVAECRGPRKPDASVWFFDHDFVETYRLEDSFVAWLSRFLVVQRSGA